ncbi:MAG: hypothetical protein ABW032_05315, partial [Burkholderiaceae bacterium]
MARYDGLMAAALAIMVAGCGAVQAPGADPARDEYRRPDGHALVRIEPIERDAPPNDQPAAVDPERMRAALAGVHGQFQALTPATPVFSADELAEIASPLASALAKASPAEDVTFRVLGSHGLFGSYSPTTATAGRVFVRGGKLNLIFGVVRSTYETSDHHDTSSKGAPGRRKSRVEYGWELQGDGAQAVDRRGDWLQFDLANLPQ